jgi:hypothetical protein
MVPAGNGISACPFDRRVDRRQNGSMEASGVKARLPSRWAGVEEILPQSLGYLAGPSSGVVDLPFDLAWSGRRSFDLGSPVQRYMYHMAVLTSGITPEHFTAWLNADLLRADWGRLGLPRPLRGIWEGRFPELAPARAGNA